MTRVPRPAKLSPVFLLLALITLALSSWGLYTLARLAGMPPELALLVVAGLDLAAVAFGKHALTVAADGDSSLPWNAGLLLLTGLGAYAQLAVHQLRGDPLAFGLVSMAFPVVTVALFEGQLRRRFRLQGRAAGRVPEPRATVDLMTWVFYRALAVRATKLAVLDRGLTPDEALMIAERQIAAEAREAATPAPRRRGLRRTYAVELADGAVETLDIPAERLDVPRPPVPERPDVRDEDDAPANELPGRGAIARAVRAASGRHGDNLPDILADVRTIFPDVREDTVARTLRRQAGAAS